ncbi:MAG: hypothetical protein AAF841_01290 [Pseudomonadota bacterium]
MIERDDLRAAVAAGMISEAQAASLAALSNSRKGAREKLAEGDEPFELFRGFNEVFIIVGLGILATGYFAVAALFVVARTGDLTGRTALAAIVGALILWLLSEYFIRVRRMVGPAIALALLWAGCAAIGLTSYFAQPFMLFREDYTSLASTLAITTLAILLHWFRFRVPFSLALVAISAFALSLVLAAQQVGRPESLSELFLFSADGPFAWITLLVGVITFCFAMAFDLSDPHRVTRRSANGFWLHVIAAPAMLNAVALSLLEGEAYGALLIVLLLVALIAIVIDRRSFLITAVGYSLTLAFIVFEGQGGAVSILILGVALVALGAFWERLRGALMRLLAGVLPVDRLPPAV